MYLLRMHWQIVLSSLLSSCHTHDNDGAIVLACSLHYSKELYSQTDKLTKLLGRLIS